MATVVIAEKPSVARDIAAVLGADRRRPAALAGNDYVVTWAIGHLVGIAEPAEMEAAWKAWRWERLPMIPGDWKLKVLPGTADHFEAVRGILNDPETERVVCATDAGREGELIFRYVYALAGCNKPVERLWISSLTPDAIREGFAALRPGSDYDALAQAAEARSRADWLVGMNLSRAYSLRHGPGVLSVGRVQTPTLAILVDRERAIRAFVPERYCEVHATFGPEPADSYEATWFDPSRVEDDGRKADRLPADGELAGQIRDRCLGREGLVISCAGNDRTQPAPLLYDLTELQRHANRLYGMTAQEVLGHAQALYEKHKLLTYPRTDSRHLSADVAVRLGPVVDAIASRYPGLVAPGSGKTPLTARFVDDAKVTDHHAIIPTAVRPGDRALQEGEARVYDLVCRRLLMAYHADFRTRVTTVVTQVDSPKACDRFRASGTVVTQAGWKVLDIGGAAKTASRRKKSKKATDAPGGDEEGAEAPPERKLPDGLSEGQVRPVATVAIVPGETTPPKHFTDASLLTAMETAGKLLDDREFQEAMRERGLGTPATRAATIETLIQRQYAERKGKSLRATDKGCALIDVVNEKVKSPAMTGEWERDLKRMERGDGTLPEFMARIEAYVREVVGLARRGNAAPVPSSSSSPVRAGTPSVTSTPASRDRSRAGEALQQSGASPIVVQAARQAARGGRALIVGAPLPEVAAAWQSATLARDGCAVVIVNTPDRTQALVTALDAAGYHADCLHPDRERDALRAASKAYLSRQLDFLAVTPDALEVPGVVAMLEKGQPTLLAIEEASRLVAGGAGYRSAWARVQDLSALLDSVPILGGMPGASRALQDMVSGCLGGPPWSVFRTLSVLPGPAIEVWRSSRAGRARELLRILEVPSHLPAVVRVPTRKEALLLASGLVRHSGVAVVHRGLGARERKTEMQRFLTGDADTLITTGAINDMPVGRGIRLLVHAGLPASLDGWVSDLACLDDEQDARALLLVTPTDRDAQDSLAGMSRWDASQLREVLAKVPPEGMDRDAFEALAGPEPEVVTAAVDALSEAGALTCDAAGHLDLTHNSWESRWAGISALRNRLVDEVEAFLDAGGCRHDALIRAYGQVSQGSCGRCDHCRPLACKSRRFRPLSGLELEMAATILATVRTIDGEASGRLYGELVHESQMDRGSFERLLSALNRAGLLSLSESRREADGRVTTYRRVHRAVAADDPVVLLRARVFIEEKVD